MIGADKLLPVVEMTGGINFGQAVRRYAFCIEGNYPHAVPNNGVVSMEE